MADIPVLFSAPMVRALIEGRKTQTRRLLYRKTKNLRTAVLHDRYRPDGLGSITPHEAWTLSSWANAKPGDRLWVREAWRTFVSLDGVAPSDLLTGLRGAGIAFEAGGGASISKIPQREFRADYSLEPRADRAAFGRRRAAMHMPLWASRLTLHVTEVGVHRLHDISEDDAEAEGIFEVETGDARGCWTWHGAPDFLGCWKASSAYLKLWAALHGEMSAQVNPWVVAIGFRTVMANIGAPEAQIQEAAA